MQLTRGLFKGLALGDKCFDQLVFLFILDSSKYSGFMVYNSSILVKRHPVVHSSSWKMTGRATIYEYWFHL